jgi:hydroxymethylpyrimidine/phosphomethylpyrimidine kinase
MVLVALTIAGSDPSGGAGVQADLKTFHQLGVYGTAAITLITVQNSTRLSRIEVLDAALVAEQIRAVLEDTPPNAIKTGALGNRAVIEAIAALTLPCPLVVDPVMIGKHGGNLLRDAAGLALLLPHAALVTPNLAEAAELAGIAVETPKQMREAALRISESGVGAVLVKGGHLEGEALDILLHNGVFTEYCSPRIETRHTHGTGCTYSAAITAFLARGCTLEDAIRRAKEFITKAIQTAPGLCSGAGPVNHWVIINFPHHDQG